MNIVIKEFDGSRFALQFKDGFSTPLLNAVRNVPGRLWVNDKRIWLIPDTQNATDKLLQNIYETGLFNLPQSAFEKSAATQRQDSLNPNLISDDGELLSSVLTSSLDEIVVLDDYGRGYSNISRMKNRKSGDGQCNEGHWL